MNILITGVTSFIGRALARELIAEGCEVFGVVRPESTGKAGIPSKVHIIECDAGRPDMLLQKKLPEIYACVCLAWGATVGERRMDADAHRDNIGNTLALLPVLKQLGCRRVIMAGSQAEYGVTAEKLEAAGRKPYPVDEEEPPDPVSSYGRAKLEVLEKASKLCRELEMVYIHARIFSTYGAGDRKTALVPACVETFSKDEHIVLTPCSQMWNFIYIDDCVSALAALVFCAYPLPEESSSTDHVVNIGSADSRYLYEFVEDIHSVIGKGSYELTREMHPAEGTPSLYPDISKLVRLTGFRESVTFKEGIKRIYEENQCSDSVL